MQSSHSRQSNTGCDWPPAHALWPRHVAHKHTSCTCHLLSVLVYVRCKLLSCSGQSQALSRTYTCRQAASGCGFFRCGHAIIVRCQSSRSAFLLVQVADLGCGRFKGPAHFTEGNFESSDAGEQGLCSVVHCRPCVDALDSCNKCLGGLHEVLQVV